MKIRVYALFNEYFFDFSVKRNQIALFMLLFFALNPLLAVTMQRPVLVSLKLNSVTIPDGLIALENKTGCVVNYNRSLFSPSRKITLDIQNMSLSQVLNKMLADTQVGYRFVDGRTILLYKLPEPVKPGKISGKVTDEKGEPLPGASVKIPGSGKAIQTGIDGSYILPVPPGSYTVEISYISYQGKRVTGIEVKEGQTIMLNVSLKPASANLQAVTVTASYKRASAEGLLARQKNASEISNGISAEQLARTPDKNIGESLKRVSGVSSVENKFVLVRGIGERYNSAVLDGTLLPSTEAQTRNFSFDMIPSNLVDNVIVSKTVTPDMNASFGGGLIQIQTKDIPSENFMSFTAGASYNDQATGKDFLSHKRGKYDYLGFDDGRRDFPGGLEHTDRTIEPNVSLSDEEYQAKVDAQSRRFTTDNFTVYSYKTPLSQNYQFTIGRLLRLDTVSNSKFGFTGSISYRNTQSVNMIDAQTRSDWYDAGNNTGMAYDFNTTWGALLNMGIQLGNHRFSFRNTYTHVYDNTFVRTAGYTDDNGAEFISKNIPPDRIQEADDPTYTTLLQNKISGQHQVGKIKMEWNIARTSVSRQEKDVALATSRPVLVSGEYQYFYYAGSSSEPRILPMSRQHYGNSEDHYSWDLSVSQPFNFRNLRNTIKAGYFGNRKNAAFDWQVAAFTNDQATVSDSLKYLPLAEMINPENVGAGKYRYSFTPWFLDEFEGKSNTHAAYLMFDNRFLEKLRLVWGLRGEYYKYTEIRNGNNIKGESEFSLKRDKRWQWLPSANLTYSPVSLLNIRAAFSSAVVRPELLDNSQFWRYSPYLGGQFGNQGLYSTRINSVDFKTEWFPAAGQIFSAGAFYKKFDKPTELVINPASGTITYYLRSGDWAKVYGLEFELRKSLGFVANTRLLDNLLVYGNLTLQKGTVKGTYEITGSDGNKQTVPVKQTRPMYGQSPYLVNIGLQYSGDHFGFNATYNKSGYKTHIVSENITIVEFEQPRQQVDAQLSYRFLRKRMELKINAANLLNKASVFYRNTGSYELNPNAVPGGDYSDAYFLKPGFSNKYEEGDQLMFRQKFGRTYSTSLSYNF